MIVNSLRFHLKIMRILVQGMITGSMVSRHSQQRGIITWRPLFETLRLLSPISSLAQCLCCRPLNSTHFCIGRKISVTLLVTVIPAIAIRRGISMRSTAMTSLMLLVVVTLMMEKLLMMMGFSPLLRLLLFYFPLHLLLCRVFLLPPLHFPQPLLSQVKSIHVAHILWCLQARMTLSVCPFIHLMKVVVIHILMLSTISSPYRALLTSKVPIVCNGLYYIFNI